MSKVTFHIAFERNYLKPCSLHEHKLTNRLIVDDHQKAAERAVEMANRPGRTGGSVIICVLQKNAGYLSLVEPGDTISSVEIDIREKAIR